MNYLSPLFSLNKAFLKVKLTRDELNLFKTNLHLLITQTNLNESEEFNKNLLRDFLVNTYYQDQFLINTKDKNDLVIYKGKNSTFPVNVIFETKKISEKKDFPSLDNLNCKALQQLLFYYLQERIINKNLEIKYLIITNNLQWFFFDAQIFEKYFINDKILIKQFTDFIENRLSGKKTDYFYQEIAFPALENVKNNLIFTYFDLIEYQEILLTALTPQPPLPTGEGEKLALEKKLIPLYKIFTPEHLLKLPFANDSNSLNKAFYSELLYLLGLTEVKEGNKKLIQREKITNRNQGSLLENTINQIKTLDKLSRLENVEVYGENEEEQLFNLGLKLVITWINRILFLKLLEAQLIRYHQGNLTYSFLNLTIIKNYDDLNCLFFQVLACKIEERTATILEKWGNIPYLNSSLFEVTEIEHQTIVISNLTQENLPIFKATVLKDSQGKKQGGDLNCLEYLFNFLDSYDFGESPEGAIISRKDAKTLSLEGVKKENKSLINASVLGLIFEKINGYKDGSFFTPGFITMYMCKETIRRAVIQKFNDVKNWNCKNIDDLYNKIEDKIEANNIINSLKICDPAVGSGHFLVSALNEIIAIKSELQILIDKNGKTLRDYQITIENDELIIINDDGDFFTYNPNNKESQRVQETLFHEKQTIIKNCLFGVDINDNSVKICRLRLWIELLKNSYYHENQIPDFSKKSGIYRQLETLPNIDINIKHGNSLISRFALNSDLKTALKKNNCDIVTYQNAVKTYRNAENKAQKREIISLIESIKNNFKQSLYNTDPKKVKLRKLENELYNLENQLSLLEESKKDQKVREKKINQLQNEIDKLNIEIEEIENGKLYQNAFEWRFEFPEVLNNQGDFIGFDVIIGNPPYFSISTDSSLNTLAHQYLTFSSTGDIYALFIELGLNILKSKGIETFIISNKWMRANYGKSLRKYLGENSNPIELIDFGQNLLFDRAIVHTNIILTENNKNTNSLKGVRFTDNFFTSNTNNFIDFIQQNTINKLQVSEDIWNVITPDLFLLKTKIEKIGKQLLQWDISINFGIKTGYNEAFIIDEKTKNELLKADPKNAEIIKPILRGRDTRRYYCNYANLWLINSHNGYQNRSRIDIINDYPNLYKYLLKYENKARKRADQGDHWTNLRNCAYLDKFTQPKIIFSEIVSTPQFYYDEEGYYPEATVFFISGKHLKYLTALLNSKAVTFFFKTFYMGGELVGKIRYKKAFLEKVPFPIPLNKIENIIENLVNEILKMKQNNPNIDISKLEKEIDLLVYELYELTEDEIKIVEGN